MSTDFSILADSVIDAFAEEVTIILPVDAPIDELTGQRPGVDLRATVMGNVGRSSVSRLQNEVTEETLDVSVRVADVPFAVGESCLLLVKSRDRNDQPRQITSANRVCGGTMYQITTFRMK